MADTIGGRIKKLRQMHNFTGEQVADYLGFEKAQIAELENNELKLKSSSLKRLCELYFCSEEYIMSGEGQYFMNFTSPEDLDLKTLASMNRIIMNLMELSELN